MDEVLDVTLEEVTDIDGSDAEAELEVGRAEAVGVDVAASVEVTGTGGKSVAAMFSGSEIVPVI